MPKIKEYKDDIFMIEIPEGGGIDEAGIVGFTGWPDTLSRKPSQPIRFYAKVVGFEDDRATMRNWQRKDARIVVDKDKTTASGLMKYLEEML